LLFYLYNPEFFFTTKLFKSKFNYLIYVFWLNVHLLKLDIHCVSTDGYIEWFDWKRIYPLWFVCENGYIGWFNFNWVFVVIYLMVGFIEWFNMHFLWDFEQSIRRNCLSGLWIKYKNVLFDMGRWILKP